MKRRRKAVKKRLISNVFFIEIKKMRDSGFSYKEIAKKLSVKHCKHFSVGLIFTCYKSTLKSSASVYLNDK